jgi:hypothetical protein
MVKLGSKIMREATVLRMQRRVEDLVHDFSACCDRFDEAHLFTGPSLYFHNKTLARRQKYAVIADVLRDEDFFESLYATLTSWGMHRMGDTKAKLVDLSKMVSSFREQESALNELASIRICDIPAEKIPKIAAQIWSVLSRLSVGVGETRIVAGSKALHHLLPDLVPPIDRQYTIRFFYHHKTLCRGDESTFTEIYPHFHHIAVACKDKIETRMGRSMHTSITKVLDNAIVGYGLKHLRSSKHESPPDN